jgi:Uncharacterised nucleotidyltransferase
MYLASGPQARGPSWTPPRWPGIFCRMRPTDVGSDGTPPPVRRGRSDTRIPAPDRPGRSGEAELVIRCARVRMDDEDSARVRALAQGPTDWALMIEMAQPEGVVPLVHATLTAMCADLVPPDVLEALRRGAESAADRNRALADALPRVLHLLGDRGVRALSFKGPELASEAYGNAALRPFGDLDILVAPSDVARADALLLAQGYRKKGPQEGQFFYKGEGGLGIDLHWRIGAKWVPSPGSFEELWARAREVRTSGGPVRTLAPEDLLLVLTIQLARDFKLRKQRVIQLADIAELIRTHRNLDWERTLEGAAAAGALRILYLGLYLAEGLMGVELPEGVARRVKKDRVVHRLASFADAQLVTRWQRRRDPGAPRPGPGVPGHAFFLQSRERPRDRARYVLAVAPDLVRLAVTPTDRDRSYLSLPAPLTPLYYVVRPARVLRRWLRTGQLILD